MCKCEVCAKEAGYLVIDEIRQEARRPVTVEHWFCQPHWRREKVIHVDIDGRPVGPLWIAEKYQRTVKAWIELDATTMKLRRHALLKAWPEFQC